MSRNKHYPTIGPAGGIVKLGAPQTVPNPQRDSTTPTKEQTVSTDKTQAISRLRPIGRLTLTITILSLLVLVMMDYFGASALVELVPFVLALIGGTIFVFTWRRNSKPAPKELFAPKAVVTQPTQTSAAKAVAKATSNSTANEPAQSTGAHAAPDVVVKKPKAVPLQGGELRRVLTHRGPRAKFRWSKRLSFGRYIIRPTEGNISPSVLADLNRYRQNATLEDEKADLIKRLRYLARRGLRGIFGFFNGKSATKTVNGVSVGTVISEYTRKNTYVIPATLNTSTSTLALFAGVEGKKITVSEYARDIDKFANYGELSERVPRTEWGLGVISEDKSNKNSVAGNYVMKLFRKIVRKTIPNIDFLILDGGNDNIQLGSIALAAAQFSHVMNFPHRVDDPVTATLSQQTIGSFVYVQDVMADEEHERSTPEQEQAETLSEADIAAEAKTGASISIRTKLEHAILIASKCNEVPEQSYWEELVNPTPDPDEVDQEGYEARDKIDWKGVGLTVPEDNHLAMLSKKNPKTGVVTSFRLDQIQLETEVAALRVAVANLETLALLQKKDLGRYHPLFAPKPEDPALEEQEEVVEGPATSTPVDLVKHEAPVPSNSEFAPPADSSAPSEKATPSPAPAVDDKAVIDALENVLLSGDAPFRPQISAVGKSPQNPKGGDST